MIQSFHKLTGGTDTTPRAILRADSVFEIALGLALVACAAASLLGAGDFPSPVGASLVAVFGIALLPIGALLWRLSLGPVPAGLLRTLAAANLATGTAALAWRLAAAGFSTTGSALTIATAAALALLAAAQLRASA